MIKPFAESSLIVYLVLESFHAQSKSSVSKISQLTSLCRDPNVEYALT